MAVQSRDNPGLPSAQGKIRNPPVTPAGEKNSHRHPVSRRRRGDPSKGGLKGQCGKERAGTTAKVRAHPGIDGVIGLLSREIQGMENGQKKETGREEPK